MKKVKPTKKLLLTRETIRKLTDADLSGVAGGAIAQKPPSYTCTSISSFWSTNHNERLLSARRRKAS